MNSKKAKSLRKKLRKTYDDLEERGQEVNRSNFKSTFKKLKELYKAGVVLTLLLMTAPSYADNLYIPVKETTAEQFRDILNSRGYRYVMNYEKPMKNCMGVITQEGNKIHLKTYEPMQDKELEQIGEVIRELNG